LIEIQTRGISLTSGGKPNFQMFELGGENPNAPDDAALGGRRVVLAAEIRQMGRYRTA
jgi:hypothetical protein